MIALRRLAEPQILVDNKASWTDKYLVERAAKPGKRPAKSQYGHGDVLRALASMSFHKCFYCEESTKGASSEVDHHVEVAERPDLAFEWTNLYLSCRGCNGGKPPNASIPVAGCVDPCAPDANPGAHLSFEDEQIRARADSERGRETIRKYGLDRERLDGKRSKALRDFDQRLLSIKNAMIRDGRTAMTLEETEILCAYAQAERPFSLMFRLLLQRLGF